jgi:hypothetical protein
MTLTPQTESFIDDARHAAALAPLKVSGALGHCLGDALRALADNVAETGEPLPGIARFHLLATAVERHREGTFTTIGLLDKLAEVLREKLPEAQVDEILNDVHERLVRPRPDIDQQLAAALVTTKKSQEKALNKLRGTDGTKWASWGNGHYVVTQDGSPIGSIHAAGRVNGDNRGWLPSPDNWGAKPFDGEPCKTLSEAALVVWGMWVHRVQEEQKEARS